MKKVVKFIFIILIFVTINVILLVPTYAISSCVEDHFSNLKTTTDEESGTDIIRTPPSENSCPYTAMSMLLSFYDTYWNDRFVDEHYDWQAGTYNATTDTLAETFSAKDEAADLKALYSAGSSSSVDDELAAMKASLGL